MTILGSLKDLTGQFIRICFEINILFVASEGRHLFVEILGGSFGTCLIGNFLFMTYLWIAKSQICSFLLSYCLTYFNPMFHFCTPWKRQKSSCFPTFSGSIEMEHWRNGLISLYFEAYLKLRSKIQKILSLISYK